MIITLLGSINKANAHNNSMGLWYTELLLGSINKANVHNNGMDLWYTEQLLGSINKANVHNNGMDLWYTELWRIASIERVKAVASLFYHV